jgi:hypothetical protein
VRICFLVLVHNHVNHYQRLISALAGPNSGIFVHLDARVESKPFQTSSADFGATYISNRVAVNWGGWSLVQASLNLMVAAEESGERFDYYCLISGSDFPLRAIETISEYLAQNAPADYYNTVRIPSEVANKPSERIDRFHFDVGGATPGILARLMRRANATIEKKQLRRNYERRLGLTPCGGSQWWTLKRETFTYVLDYVRKNPSVSKFFRNVYVPDESFFQTILETSPFRGDQRRNLTFTDWSRPQPPYPAWMDSEHIERLIRNDAQISDVYGGGPALFARKFPDDSEDMVLRIKSALWCHPGRVAGKIL